MENSIPDGLQNMPADYDYRQYDRIWKRVAPDLNPYPEVRAGENSAPAEETPSPAAETPMSATEAVPAVPAAGAEPVPAMEGGEGSLPGAERNPCCMGTEAQSSLEVLEGFLEEELAVRRCCLNLACRFCCQSAARLLRCIASERQAAARELSAAYYLTTGSCYAPSVTVESERWASLAEALRSCYHQEACSGFNYLRAADETLDPCLQRLFRRLGDQAYRRAERVMALLGQMIC